MSEFKVVKIIDTKRIVINAGSNDGITADDRFEIIQQGDAVMDPDTNEYLGRLDYVKACIKIENLFPKMSVCCNVETSLASVVASSLLTMSQLESGKPMDLPVSPEDISGGYGEVDREIHVGDIVRKI